MTLVHIFHRISGASFTVLLHVWHRVVNHFSLLMTQGWEKLDNSETEGRVFLAEVSPTPPAPSLCKHDGPAGEGDEYLTLLFLPAFVFFRAFPFFPFSFPTPHSSHSQTDQLFINAHTCPI